MQLDSNLIVLLLVLGLPIVLMIFIAVMSDGDGGWWRNHSGGHCCHFDDWF